MVIILSGPSGVGKSYVCEYLTQRLGFQYPTPYTTRAKREEEIEGKHYFFTSVERIKEISDDFKNGYWENPIGDNWYGYTNDLDCLIKKQNNIILILRAELAKRIQSKFPFVKCFFLDYATTIVMRERIAERTQTETEYYNRMKFSLDEIKNSAEFTYHLISDNPNDFIKIMGQSLFLCGR